MQACTFCRSAVAHGLGTSAKHTVRTSSTAVKTAANAQVIYPEVVPKYPAGESWDGLEPKHAWMFHEEAQRVKELPTVLQKLTAIQDESRWKSAITLYPWQHIPSQGYEFVKYITKTHVIDELPEEWLPSTSVELSSTLRPALEQALRLDLARGGDEPKKQRRALLHALRQLIVLSSAAATGSNPQLATARIAADVKVRSFYKRFGWGSEDLRGKHNLSPPVVRVQTYFRNAFQLQIPLPLPEVVALDSELVLESPEPEYNFRPSTAAQFTSKQYPAMFPGHWVQDPCPHGLFSLPLFLTESERMRVEFHDQPVAQNQLQVSAGIVSAFSSTLAQAMYQGFPYLNELRYPFVHQTLLSDGRGSFRLFIYQLNTVQLHKPAAANPRKNLCWVSPSFQLWDEDLSVSAEAVSQWLQVFLKQGETRADLRPYLREAAPDASRPAIAPRDPNQPPETRGRIHRYLNV